MKKFFIGVAAVAIIVINMVAIVSNAKADQYNGVPSPYHNPAYRGQQVPAYVGNARAMLNQFFRMPRQIYIHQERGNVSSRKYGTPVGYCKTVKGSDRGIFGSLFGSRYTTICQ